MFILQYPAKIINITLGYFHYKVTCLLVILEYYMTREDFKMKINLWIHTLSLFIKLWNFSVFIESFCDMCKISPQRYNLLCCWLDVCTSYHQQFGTVTGRKLPLDMIQSVAKTNTLKLNTYADTTKEKKHCACWELCMYFLKDVYIYKIPKVRMIIKHFLTKKHWIIKYTIN